METNRNKLIFFITGGVLIFLFIIFLIIVSLNGGNNNYGTIQKSGNLLVWTLFDDIKSDEIVSTFKEKHPEYISNEIKFENFSNYEEYTYALASAISKGQGPDIFVLNNNEESIFEDQVLWLSNLDININQFRKNFKTIFTEDIIKLGSDGETEYLAGIPVGYETLGVFYNKKYIKSSDLKNISTLNTAILGSDANSTPLGIGNGEIKFAGDIATQFLLFDEDAGKSIKELSSSQVKENIGTYLNYGFSESGNNFNSDSDDTIDLFGDEKVYMLVGYPRLIKDIEEEGGVSKNFLFAEPIPHPVFGKGYTLANYDYLVLNKDSSNIEMAKDFLSFFSTDEGGEKFMQAYPYYLPALLSLEDNLEKQKIDSDYNILLGDFYNSNFELTSFDKGIKVFYDKGIKDVLNAGINFYSVFDDFKDNLICRTEKIINLTNLSNSCDY